MLVHFAQTVTYTGDLVDPTSDAILTKVVNYGLGALMVITALLGGWYAFSVWAEKKGKKEAITEIRHVAFGVIVVEAVLGGVIILANYGTGLIPGFMS